MKAPPHSPAAASPSCSRCCQSPTPSSPEYLLSKIPRFSAPPCLRKPENHSPSTPAQIVLFHPPRWRAAPPNPPPISDDDSDPSGCSNLDNREEAAVKGAGHWAPDFAPEHKAPRTPPAPES